MVCLQSLAEADLEQAANWYDEERDSAPPARTTAAALCDVTRSTINAEAAEIAEK